MRGMAWLLAAASAAATAQDSAPAPRGCAMAHCDAAMSDLARTDVPAQAVLVARDAAAPGVRGGLGCVSNLQVAVCTYGGEAPAANLVAYDGSGRRLWDDGGWLGATAWTSAPMIGRDRSVVVADRDSIGRLDLATGRVIWRSAKPDAGTPISPVPLGGDAGMVLLATHPGDEAVTAELSVWDRATGTLLSHAPLADPATGRRYVTRNTPAVRGARAYIVAEAEADAADGRVFAVDVCESSACGGRGRLVVAWQLPFAGPSGASPLLVGERLFVDGRDGPRGGTVFAVDDLGTSPRLLWQRSLENTLRTSATRDPRGGLWVQPHNGPAMLRLSDRTGAVLQTVDLGGLVGTPGRVVRTSVGTLGTLGGAGVVLLLGVRPAEAQPGPVQVFAVDVAGLPEGRLLWSLSLPARAEDNLLPGQFPVVLGPSGQRRLVVPGSRSGTFFVGEP